MHSCVVIIIIVIIVIIIDLDALGHLPPILLEVQDVDVVHREEHGQLLEPLPSIAWHGMA